MKLGPTRAWGPRAGLGLIVALSVFALDQAVKTWLLWGYGIAGRQPVAAGPFLDIVLVWNIGVSYGLFPVESETGQRLLALFKVVVSVFLWLWLTRAADRIMAVSLALIIGGALGNALDRVLYGGVADFFSLHLRAIGSQFHWYVFNIADVAIVAGVALLLYEGLFARRATDASDGRKE
jgi:signal peptidase II